jgi:hypothetical protein
VEDRGTRADALCEAGSRRGEVGARAADRFEDEEEENESESDSFEGEEVERGIENIEVCSNPSLQIEEGENDGGEAGTRFGGEAGVGELEKVKGNEGEDEGREPYPVGEIWVEEGSGRRVDEVAERQISNSLVDMCRQWEAVDRLVDLGILSRWEKVYEKAGESGSRVSQRWSGSRFRAIWRKKKAKRQELRRQGL